MIGQIVDEVSESGGLKKENYVFDISNQAKGVYILNVQTPFKTNNFKLIKLYRQIRSC